MVPKVFEPLKFDCKYLANMSHFFVVVVGLGLACQAKYQISHTKISTLVKAFTEQELSSDSIARLERCLFKVKKSFWQSFMKTGSKLSLLDSTHGFSKNCPNDLVFHPTWPILNSGLYLITMHIQTKFHEDWIKTMPSREYTWFF